MRAFMHACMFIKHHHAGCGGSFGWAEGCRMRALWRAPAPPFLPHPFPMRRLAATAVTLPAGPSPHLSTLPAARSVPAPQAAGYNTGLTPAKMVAAAGSSSAAWAGGLQDSLLSTVLKCAKAKPKQAVAFLGYATAGGWAECAGSWRWVGVGAPGSPFLDISLAAEVRSDLLRVCEDGAPPHFLLVCGKPKPALAIRAGQCGKRAE